MTPRYVVQDIETILDPEFGWVPKSPDDFPPIQAWKVLCIGMVVLDIHLSPIKVGLAAGGCAVGRGEAATISEWSRAVDNSGNSLWMVDWNGGRFDVPVLQTRAFALGLQLPWLYAQQPDKRGRVNQWSKRYRDRYRGKHYDLADLWTNYGRFGMPKLEHLAKLMGLPGKGGMDGSQVGTYYQESRLPEIDKYCLQDVVQTAFVFQRFNYMAGKITSEGYRQAASRLLNMQADQDVIGFGDIDMTKVLMG